MIADIVYDELIYQRYYNNWFNFIVLCSFLVALCVAVNFLASKLKENVLLKVLMTVMIIKFIFYVVIGVY